VSEPQSRAHALDEHARWSDALCAQRGVARMLRRPATPLTSEPRQLLKPLHSSIPPLRAADPAIARAAALGPKRCGRYHERTSILPQIRASPGSWMATARRSVSTVIRSGASFGSRLPEPGRPLAYGSSMWRGMHSAAFAGVVSYSSVRAVSDRVGDKRFHRRRGRSVRTPSSGNLIRPRGSGLPAGERLGDTPRRVHYDPESTLIERRAILDANAWVSSAPFSWFFLRGLSVGSLAGSRKFFLRRARVPLLPARCRATDLPLEIAAAALAGLCSAGSATATSALSQGSAAGDDDGTAAREEPAMLAWGLLPCVVRRRQLRNGLTAGRSAPSGGGFTAGAQTG